MFLPGIMPRLAIALLVALGVAEGARFSRKTAANVSAGVGREASALWDSYVNSVTSSARSAAGGLQSECFPVKAEAQGNYRGAVLLYHGFTACPQQYKQLIPLLTAKGFTVFTPVFPGHGYKWTMKEGKAEDYIENMPTDVEQWRDFGREMHTIMMAANGKKALFGLSLGGSLAAWQAATLGGYDHHMIGNPMIGLRGIMQNAVNLGIRLPWRRYSRLEMGGDCEDERIHGRAGICQFNPAIGAAARDVGEKHRLSAEVQGSGVDTQLVFMDGDTAVSNWAIFDLANRYGFDKSSKNVCGMAHAVGHSFLAPPDNVGVDMYWLPDMQREIIAYLTSGVSLTHGNEKAEEGWARCKATCKGNC